MRSRLTPEVFAEAFRIVEKNHSVVEALSGPGAVVFFGMSQVGKSTILNALRGAPFGWIEDDDGETTPVGNDLLLRAQCGWNSELRRLIS
jgi:GTPase SAR1 family protein